MTTQHYIFLIFLVIHFFVTLKYQRKVYRSRILEPKGKVIHSILIWLFPFVWWQMIKGYLNEDLPTNTKTLRDKRRKERDDGGFYESKKGFPGNSLGR
ncbi:MAG: hypothetical protein MK105_17910 [Crocinitomicaceae bacterium]|nr:hypothetical protein [Crocinitomicaceae bacterium]